VNLLGEHVDYNDGMVLPAAIDRATYVAFSGADADQFKLYSADYEEQAIFSTVDLEAKNGTDGRPLPGWAKYPAGVAWAILAQGRDVKGLNAVFASDVPRGAGLSSSASVELAFATAWKALGAWSIPAMQMAVLCQRAENLYVGVQCGIMDQAASACGKEGCVLLLDCRTLQYQALALPEDIAIIIADTGVRHSLAGSAYNRRRAACEEAVRLLRHDLPDITALRDVSISDFHRLAGGLPMEMQMRARHVVEEIDRMRRAVPLLQAGDERAFGALMNACHTSLRDLYEVSCPELDTMVRIAQSMDGCFGARLTGGGFGGCTVNLVARAGAAGFVEALGNAYASETGHHPEIYVCRASGGAGLV
jgi:galactokinase